MKTVHTEIPILTNPQKTETVLSPDVTDQGDHGQVEPMLFPVKQFRHFFADDLEICCRPVVEDEQDKMVVCHVKELPSDIAVACLICPLVGGMLYF
jgi:hypothetical protein